MDDISFRIYKLAVSGFCCSQIMIIMALEEEERENEDLVKASHGLCGGINLTQKTCGCIISGIQILGMYGGKGSEDEYCKENFKVMMDEYMEWFEEKFESTDCIDLVGVQIIKDDEGNATYPVKCGDIVKECYLKIQQILYENEYDFGDRE